MYGYIDQAHYNMCQCVFEFKRTRLDEGKIINGIALVRDRYIKIYNNKLKINPQDDEYFGYRDYYFMNNTRINVNDIKLKFLKDL